MIQGYFQGLHPAVSFTYFAAVIGMTLACMHPVLSPLSFLGAAAFLVCLKGWKSLLGTLKFLLPMMAVIIIANPLFNHRGVTMLFILFDQWITLEAIGYGAVSACQLAAVVLWFACYQEVITSDKFLFLFGQIAPAAALLITLTLRLIPQLKSMAEEIRQVQGTLHGEENRLTQRMAAAVRNLSVLLTWSMENAVQTADSMKARGFGQKRRTTYHLFRFDSRDARCSGLIVALLAAAILFRVFGFGYVEFYPRIRTLAEGAGNLWQGAILILLYFLPVLLEKKEAVRWRSYSMTA